jgi:hypothetical protein
MRDTQVGCDGGASCIAPRPVVMAAARVTDEPTSRALGWDVAREAQVSARLSFACAFILIVTCAPAAFRSGPPWMPPLLGGTVTVDSWSMRHSISPPFRRRHPRGPTSNASSKKVSRKRCGTFARGCHGFVSPIGRVVTRKSMHVPDSDIDYWRTRPVEERLQALVDLRREVEGWTSETEPRLPRVA